MWKQFRCKHYPNFNIGLIILIKTASDYNNIYYGFKHGTLKGI